MTEQRKIDLTPTWAEAMTIYALALENGTGEGRAAARKELARVAEILDQLNSQPTTGTTELYEVLASKAGGTPFGVTFTTQEAADAYTDRLTAAGYNAEGTCAFDAHAEAGPALASAADYFSDPSLSDDTAAPAPLFAVARRQPNSAPRFLRYVDRRPCWTADSAKADRMTHDEAERLAADWNEHAASKGFDRRAYVHKLEADQ